MEKEKCPFGKFEFCEITCKLYDSAVKDCSINIIKYNNRAIIDNLEKIMRRL